MAKLLYAALALALSATGVAAQDYPNKPVRLMVGFAAGGGTDITARIVGKKLTENLGQQFVIENRAGGGGIIAAELVAQAPGDGYTIMLGTVGVYAVSPHMQKLNFDIERDYLPITMGVTFPNVLVVHPSSKAMTLADYITMAKDQSNRLAYGSSGVGGAGHLAGELLKMMAKIDVPHVAYRGGGPAMADLLGNQVPSVFASLPSALPQIQENKIRALAVTGAKRSTDMPTVPTVAEAGYPGYEATNWYAYVAPKGTPRAIIEKLSAEIGRAQRDPDVLKEFAKHGLEPAAGTPEELAAYIKKESTTWARVVKEANIKAD